MLPSVLVKEARKPRAGAAFEQLEVLNELPSQFYCWVGGRKRNPVVREPGPNQVFVEFDVEPSFS